MAAGKFKILVSDRQPSLLRSYDKLFGQLGHELQKTSSLREIDQYLMEQTFDLVLLDLELDAGIDENYLTRLVNTNPQSKVVAVSDRSSISGAVKAIRAGCHDYLAKPVSLQSIQRALGEFAHDSKQTIKKQFSTNTNTKTSVVGHSPVMQRVQILTSNFARSTAPVLITGESGTGKEVFAAELHRLSERAEGPFVPINCAALPKDLIESELFGHIKGAFTGASSDRIGAAQAAHGGTLFLDEIGEMDIGLQAKLLRFLQTGEIKKVGTDRAQIVDVRVVCATNRVLPHQIDNGAFREDLYYRLNVLTLSLPPLRERGNDIVELAKFFYNEAIELEGCVGGGLAPCAIMALVEHSWPGNVRELQNIIRRGVVMSGGGRLDASDLFGLGSANPPTHPLDRNQEGLLKPVPISPRRMIDVERPLAEIEREIVETVISLKGGSLPKAAATLELSPSTLYRKREAWRGGEQQADDAVKARA